VKRTGRSSLGAKLALAPVLVAGIVVALAAVQLWVLAGVRAAGDPAAVASDGARLTVIAAVAAAALGVVVLLVVRATALRPLQPIIASLFAASRQVMSAADQVAVASQEMANGASEQAAGLEEASSSLEEMAATTQGDLERRQEKREDA